ncbi:MAG: MarR family transcriptional regulator [Frankiales bacterium]|nr:MarR family transcriptional regulator [Frankiales bacterium]
MTVTKQDSDLPRDHDAALVAESFSNAVGAHLRLKAQIQADTRRGPERSAIGLISCLASNGSMRASALAEAAQADPSTVSRQVAALVSDGLVERRADPLDGRASVLALTDRGQQAHQQNSSARIEFYRLVLQGWDAAEVSGFAAQLARFAAGLERNRPAWSREDPKQDRPTFSGVK